MSRYGRESVPPMYSPREIFTPEKRPLRSFLNSGMPQIAQQAMRIAQGSQA